MKKILTIPIILLITGCYNYTDLNDMAIVSAISISSKNNNYEIKIEIINPEKKEEKNSYKLYKSIDSSLEKAINKISLTCPKQLYLSHMNILILDETILNNNLSNILDFFARKTEIRNKFYIIVKKNNENPLEITNSKNIISSLKTTHNSLGYTNIITFQDLLDTYLNPNKELAIPSLKIKPNSNTIIISTIAIFKNNKLINYLDEKDSLAYNIIENKINNYIIKTNINKEKTFTCKIIKEKTKISKNNNTTTIKINGNAILSETNTKGISLNTKELETYLNKNIKIIITNSLNKVLKNYNTNIYSNNLNNPKIKVNIKITQKGNINKGVTYE